jgi:hypothetical protein
VQVPTSEAQRYIDALPNGVTPLFKCEDKPEEKCHCVEDVVWEDAEIVTEISRNELGINVEKKVIKNSESKKSQREAEKESKKAAKKALKQSIKDDLKDANSVAKLKALIEKLIEAQE